MVVFHPFDQPDLDEIVSSELQKWRVRALKRHNINLTWDPLLVSNLAEGFNRAYGFRSIKHDVEKRVINLVAGAYERNEIVRHYH